MRPQTRLIINSMKKTSKQISNEYIALIILLLMICTGCSKRANTINEKNSYYTSSKKDEIKLNKNNWEKKQKKAEIHNMPMYVESIPQKSKSPDSIKAIAKNHGILVQGTVINLEKGNQSIRPTTKIILHIDKVITGNKNIQGKNIKYFTAGGILPKDAYTGVGYTSQSDGQTVYVKYDRYPIPEIGNKVIVSLKKGEINFVGKKDHLEQYDLKNEEEEYWIFDSKTCKYIMNNKLIRNY